HCRYSRTGKGDSQSRLAPPVPAPPSIAHLRRRKSNEGPLYSPPTMGDKPSQGTNWDSYGACVSPDPWYTRSAPKAPPGARPISSVKNTPTREPPTPSRESPAGFNVELTL